MTTRQKGIDKFVNLEFPPYITYGACTTISVYENLSKNSFFIRVRKPTPPVCRSCSRFASAKVELFHKLAKKRERIFKKKKKKECKKDNNNRNEESTPYYIIYIGGVSGFGFQVSSLLFSYAHQAKASQASSIPREKRQQLSVFICFTQRTQRAQSF